MIRDDLADGLSTELFGINLKKLLKNGKSLYKGKFYHGGQKSMKMHLSLKIKPVKCSKELKGYFLD